MTERSKRSLDFPDELFEWIQQSGTRSDTFSDFVRRACWDKQRLQQLAADHEGELSEGWVVEAAEEYLKRRNRDVSEVAGGEADA